MANTVSCDLGGKTLTIESGKLAKQANGSVLVSYGDTRVLVTACGAKEAKEGQSFFPLTVEYSEKFYAAGKIPGSFFRREGRPTSEATLTARMIDRPIRPLFPEGYFCDTQVVATVISFDPEASAEVAASIGASAALHISDLPFNGPTAACRMGRIGGNWVINPSVAQLESGESDLDVTVAGTAKAVMMVEGGANEVPEAEMLEGILKCHEEIKKVCGVIEELRSKCGLPKREFIPQPSPEGMDQQVRSHVESGLSDALRTEDKQERYNKLDLLKKDLIEKMVSEEEKKSDPEASKKKEKFVSSAYEDLKYDMMRKMILDEGVRIDGRDTRSIRNISTEVGLLPRAHGSALFTRGETQILAAVTLGTGEDEQIIDNLDKDGMRQYLFHYNFPPFSVGECGRMGGQSRREIGHGALAGRAIQPILPKHEDFPYTLRVVCETLESNGSSSMGSVCSSSMALMHAGVPFQKPVAGIAMGLIKEEDRVAVLSDILGDEDHLGDMDFKVAGTQEGITAIQMDIKIEGVNEEIMRTALSQAKEGRLHILGEMAKTIENPQGELSRFAPVITSITVAKDKIALVIGPSGKNIKEIVAQTGCKVDINDDGRVNVASADSEAAQKALKMIEDLVAEVELDKVYKGKVKKIVDFGAFIGILPNQDGLLHVSEIAHERVHNVDDYLKEGDEVEVKVIEIDQAGKVRLSRRVLLPVPEGGVPPRGGGRDRDDRGNRPPRDRDRGRKPFRGNRGGKPSYRRDG